MKTLPLAAVAALLVGGPFLRADVREFLGSHCTSCHGEDNPKGGLDLGALGDPSSSEEAYQQWVRIHDRVASEEMPPATAKRQPSGSERGVGVSELGTWLMDRDRLLQREQGRVPMRRLNRTEYEHTVRDLFALPGLQVRELLPADGRRDGFEKTSEALEISAAQIRKYMEVADVLLDAAIATHERPAPIRRRLRMLGSIDHLGEAVFPLNKGRVDLDRIRSLGRQTGVAELVEVASESEALALITQSRLGFQAEVQGFSAPVPGPYRIHTRLFSFRPGPDGELLPEPRGQYCELAAGKRFLRFLDAPSLQPADHEVVTWLNAGETLELNPTSLWPNYFNILHPSTPALAAHMKWPGLAHPFHYRGPAVAVEFIDVEGPLHDQWPPESHRRLLGDLAFGPVQPGAGGSSLRRGGPGRWSVSSANPDAELPAVVGAFLNRAFRRPASPEELDTYLGLARKHLGEGTALEEALRSVFQIALCSPDFLYLREPAVVVQEPDMDGSWLRIDPFAAASRLSYFLWNSCPDEELIRAARAGALDGEGLRRQALRMLADPRASRFVDDFVDQWLGLRDIDFTSPDVALYPEFRSDLRHSMVAETREFFRLLLNEDLGVRNFVDSDFVCLNQRLAEHYGIPDVPGSTLRKVPKPAGSPRGGFLTQGAILKITANGTVTSPVKRGAWVLDRILGTPPRPPPPNTPAVEPDVRGATTIRRQLELHRSSPSCASCHDHIDPPGFALESFDVIGAWRSHYRFRGLRYGDPEQRRGRDPALASFPGIPPSQWADLVPTVRLGAPVDSTGTTMDGSDFADIHEYKRLLLQHEEAIARAFVNRLVLYATGAPVRFGDRPQVEAILRAARSRQYGVRTLLLELVGSRIFLEK